MITNTKHISMSALYALAASLTAVSLLFVGFFLAEPVISHGQEVFTIQQTITDETSFLVIPTDVSMAGSINGVTGGNATGTTQFVIQSNNSAGYVVNIGFTDDNADGEMMEGDADDSGAIRDYDNTGEPDYSYSASTSAQFAYTVTSSTTGDTDQSFLTNGSNACNTPAGADAGTTHCWKAPDTSTFDIVNRSTAANSGATTTVQFNVNVPGGATPVPTAQTYTATATLTLIAN
ncbi:MAG: hypothetical protein LR008_00055 [Candidatus Pacebacteria bacterium]|nr:hypothetical protein [Candidatus Paceibacterota bacterium]